MQHAAISRSEWRKKLRSRVTVCRGAAARVRRVRRLAGASLLMLILLSGPAARGAAGGHGQATRPPGYLGIEFHDLTNEQATALHLRDKRGVEVLLVDHDGPAASAGLQPHDLITGFNGHIVASGEALRRVIRETGAGVQVTLSVFRNGNPITIHTKLANREDIERKAWARLNQAGPGPSLQGMAVSGGSAPALPAPPPPVATHVPPPAPHKSEGFIETMLHGPSAGLVVEGLQPQLGNYFGAPKGEGLLVQSVEDGSAAATAGVHAGDVILRADDQPMHAASDWSKHLHATKGKPISVELLRDHQQMTVTVQPGAKK